MMFKTGDDGHVYVSMPQWEHEITMEQATMLGALRKGLEGEGQEIDHWHMCDSGCCVIAHIRGRDETAWMISRDGVVEHLDRYGNTIFTTEDM